MSTRQRNDGERYIFVLDTNVLLFDPKSLEVFDEHELVIPITVIEEVDRFKKDLNETGRNARVFSRKIDALRTQGDLRTGVELENGGRLWVAFPPTDLEPPSGLIGHLNDNMILKTALGVEKNRSGRVVLVSRDTNMRIKADAIGLIAEDYENAHIQLDEHYSGFVEFSVPPELLADAYTAGTIDIDRLDFEEDQALLANQFWILKNHSNPKHSAVMRYDAVESKLVLVKKQDKTRGISPRNVEQMMALDLLLDPKINFVTLTGMAGTGKTLLAMAAGLAMTDGLKEFGFDLYRKLVVSRPIFPMGRDLGFLPGDISEKLNPWMKPIFDNLEFLVGMNGADAQHTVKTLLEQRLIEVEPLTYIRGRSLPNQFFIVDESQNLTPHEIKTVITRAGQGTKIVMTGDPYQIDNPYVDVKSNGLSYVIERFKTSPLAGHITLRKGERSELAELAATLL